VPSSIKEVKITGSIDLISSSFRNCIYIEKIDLSESNYLSIGAFTFDNMTNLKTIILPENIQKIVNSLTNGFYVNKNITLKFIGPERPIEGLDANNYKEVIWNYTEE
jgi:hypothetical protein